MSGRRISGIAVVTGGASGIGAACCRVLADAGATVVVLDRDEARGNAIAAEVKGRAWVADVGDEKALDECAGAIEAAVGPVDVLVNSAGVLQQPLPPGTTADVVVGRGHPHRSARHLRGFGRVRPAHGAARTRQHHQHRLDRRDAVDADACLRAGQSSGHRHHRMPCRRMGTLRRAGQCGVTGLYAHARPPGARSTRASATSPCSTRTPRSAAW